MNLCTLRAKAENLVRIDWPAGSSREIVGITSRPELNGKVVQIQHWVTESGRFACLLDNGEIANFKPDNLRMRMRKKRKQTASGIMCICGRVLFIGPVA